jgi:hypothetical protein
MTSEDINDFINTSIDLENGFKKFLLRLRCRLIQDTSKQALDSLFERIFRKPIHRSSEEKSCVTDVPEYADEDFQYHIPSSISPRELVEKLLEYELKHYHFYNSLKEVVVYTESQDTCDILVNYKVQQINDTKSVLDEICASTKGQTVLIR